MGSRATGWQRMSSTPTLHNNAVASSFTRWMAFDFGHKRTGVAVGNTISLTAEPLTTVTTADKQTRLDNIAQLAKEWEPQALVVGIPCHPDGTEHDMTRSARKFCRQLHHHLQLPVFTVDERYSSVEAEAHHTPNQRGTRRTDAQTLDALSAQIILQRFFETL